MPDLSLWLGFLITSFMIVIVPGPTVTVIIANSLRYGARAGLFNVLGTQMGLIPMVFIVAFGLDKIVTMLGQAFIALKICGAIYLIWLGYKLLRSKGNFGVTDLSNPRLEENKQAKPGSENSALNWILQGFITIWSNPKALFLFVALIPQFITPGRDATTQAMALGATFMLVGMIFDGMYALLAGGARQWLVESRIRVVEIFSGLFLIAGGIWLALSKSN